MKMTPPWSRLRWTHPARTTSCPMSSFESLPHACVLSMSFCPSWLEPAESLEYQEKRGGREQHQHESKGVAPSPLEFRHVGKVHSVHSRDECRDHQPDRQRGQRPH